MNRIKTQRGLLVAVLASVVVMLGASAINADTVGYWRFESSANFLEDSGPNNFDLSTGGSPAPTYLALPGSGAGSNFDNPIPLTEQANAGVADFGTTQDGYLWCAGTDPKFDGGAFTIEAYVNWPTEVAGAGQLIASQSGGTDRKWQFGVGPANGFYIYLTQTGSHGGDSHRWYTPHFDFSADTDYYAAASFDLDNPIGGVKFYLKDLTAGTAMQTVTMDHDMTALYDSDLNFVIGSRDPTQYEWTGMIDEVRLSDCVLSQNELLAGGDTPLPGDANGDGKVTDADAAILATNWQRSGVGWGEGDFNGDGNVTDADAAILATHWQEGVTEAAAPVPEPATIVLLLGAILWLLVWRRR